MKTVMKKMFCLMLVAVLMVGVMPFQAFADGNPYYVVKLSDTETVKTGELVAGQSYDPATLVPDGYVFDWAMQNFAGGGGANIAAGTAREVGAGDHFLIFVKPAPHTHTPGAAATCTTALTCTGCGEVLEAAKGHTPGAAATCTTAQTCTVCGEVQEAAKGHNVVDGKCTNCDYTEPAAPAVRQDITWKIKYAEGGSVAKEGTFTPKNETANAKDILYYHVFNKSNAWQDEYTCTKVWSTKQQTDVTYNGSVAEGDTVTFVLTPKANDNTTQPTQPATGNSTLSIYVNLYTGNVKTATYELAKYTNLSSETLVYSFIAAHESELRAKLPSGYGWTGHVYDANNKNAAEIMNTAIGTGRTVHINAYSDADYVYVYVHTGRTYVNDRVIKMDGKKVGETITRNEVLSLVKQYYSVSSLKMYGHDVWDTYVKGGNVQAVDSLTVQEGITEVHVQISGSAKYGSSYTADSSNPKTGDMIFAPVAVLGLSASALAVLFYLNKKRAF